MMPYLLHSSVLIAASFLFYMLLLRKETFYKLNRLYLSLVLILAVTLPLISVPKWMSIQDDLWAEKTQVTQPTIIQNSNDLETKTFDSPVTLPENFIEKKPNNSLQINPSKNDNTWFSNLNLSKILWILYGIGVGVFLLTFIIQFTIILFTRFRLQYIQDGRYRIYEMTTDTAPFSFCHWIFINPSIYEYETYEQILEHEKIHVNQAHYLDKILAEFMVMVFWFNPFVWLMRREITNNLEFLADETMLKKGTERESYQMSLLKVSVPQTALSLTTNYNQSILKTRIVMMNKKKSSASSSWKYLFILPLFFFSVISINAIQTEAPIDDANLHSQNQITNNPVSDNIEIDGLNNRTKTAQNNRTDTSTKSLKDTNHKSLEKSQESFLENSQGAFFENSQGKFFESSQGDFFENSQGKFFENSQESYFEDELQQYVDKTFQKSLGNSLKEPVGSYSEDELQQTIDNSIQDSINYSSEKKQKKKLQKEKQQQKKKCKNGKTDNSCNKSANASASASATNRITTITISTNTSTNANTNTSTSTSIITSTNTSKLSAGKLTLLEMKNLSIYGVTQEFVEEIRKFDLPNISFDNLIEFAIHDVDGTYIQSIHDVGLQNINPDQLVKFSIHNISAGYISSLMDLNLKGLTIKNIEKAKIHGLTANFVKNARADGFNKTYFEDYINLKIRGW